jgi:hypothetical protein
MLRQFLMHTFLLQVLESSCCQVLIEPLLYGGAYPVIELSSF